MSVSKLARSEDEVQTLDLERYVPFYLGTISNRWTSSSSKLYLAQFGVGIVEWRILGYLGSRQKDGSSTSLEIASALSLDRGAVSRGMRVLVERGYVEQVKGRFAGSTKPLTMTAAGLILFKEIRAKALEREAYLLQDLTDAEREELLHLFKKMYSRLNGL